MKILSLLLLSVVLFTACSGNQQQAYIDATVEITCQLEKIDDASRPEELQKTRAIFEKHGFEADNADVMQKVTDKYGSLPDVHEAILQGISDCGSLDFDEQEVAR